jgi:hypothetical protein
MSDRKGFEMAISTVVVMILGILIIGGGVIMLRQLTKSGEGAVDDLSKSQIAALNGLLTQGQLVAVFPSNGVITAGDTKVFGAAVVNKLTSPTDFTVRHRVIDPAGAPLPANSPVLQVTYLDPPTMQKDTKQTIALAVKPADTAPPGVYTVLVNITSVVGAADKTYDTVRFFTVRVQ